MPSLEQIIRPFVVDPTTPPVPVVTTLNKPPPEPVRLNIGIGGTSLKSLSPKVAPIVPPKPSTAPTKPPAIKYKSLSSSYSLAATWYMTGVVTEQSTFDDGGGGGGGASSVSDTGGAGGGSQGGGGDPPQVSSVDIKFPAVGGFGSEAEQLFFGYPLRSPSLPVPDAAPAGNPPAPSGGGPVGGNPAPGGSP